MKGKSTKYRGGVLSTPSIKRTQTYTVAYRKALLKNMHYPSAVWVGLKASLSNVTSSRIMFTNALGVRSLSSKTRRFLSFHRCQAMYADRVISSSVLAGAPLCVQSIFHQSETELAEDTPLYILLLAPRERCQTSLA